MIEKNLKAHIQHPEMLADTLQVDIVSVEKSIFSGRAKMLVVSGDEGELGILPGHSPLLTSIKPGEVRLIALDGSEECFYVSGGFIEVQPEIVTILADTVVRAEDVDEERAVAAKEKAEKILASKKPDDYTEALVELTKALAQIRIAGKWHKRK
jgi:F-type H+-transporting ATPase subunit epsilon